MAAVGVLVVVAVVVWAVVPRPNDGATPPAIAAMAGQHATDSAAAADLADSLRKMTAALTRSRALYRDHRAADAATDERDAAVRDTIRGVMRDGDRMATDSGATADSLRAALAIVISAARRQGAMDGEALAVASRRLAEADALVRKDSVALSVAGLALGRMERRAVDAEAMATAWRAETARAVRARRIWTAVGIAGAVLAAVR